MRIAGWKKISERMAGTGTRYVVMERRSDGIQVTVRIGGHSECYPPPRGERRIDVSPTGMTMREAMRMLREGDLPEPSQGPRKPTAEERRWQREANEKRASMRAEALRKVKAIRERLMLEDFEYWNSHGHSRRTARELARRHGVGAGLMYEALSGQRW